MSVQLLQGDCLEVLKSLSDGIVHTCVTSPPYYGLRDYGTAKWEGGDSECDHVEKKDQNPINSGLGYPADGGARRIGINNQYGKAYKQQYKSVCAKCGAIRIDDQIGLEETPDAYVQKLVAVFREVKRVLRDDGTLWLNLGDSYGQNNRWGGHDTVSEKQRSNRGTHDFYKPADRTFNIEGLKSKDLIGIPWMVAFALRADGWYLRSDIIWAKRNCMPESVKDRPTKSHEYIFLLAKSQKYYYDADAIKEDAVQGYTSNSFIPSSEKDKSSNYDTAATGASNNNRSTEFIATRNKRDVWFISTKPYKEAHFATFPPDLIEPCVLAGCPQQACSICGNPYERITEREKPPSDVYTDSNKPEDIKPVSHPELGKVGMGGKLQDWYNEHPVRTVGYKPTCNCNADIVSGTVLDPFNGSGTTGQVAIENRRDYIGIELNPQYIELTKKRLFLVQPRFA